jgi:predicted nucleic acid-binding protein
VTTGVRAVFVDTNILIYATNRLSPWHRAADSAMLGARRRGVDLVLSPQILREYLAAATRQGAAGSALPIVDILSNVQAFQHNFRVVDDTAAVASALQALLGVATMQVYRIDHLLTHNVADFTRFSGLITVLPLLTTRW